MALYDKLTFDLKTAMKTGQHAHTNVLRFIIAQLRNREIEKRTKGDVSPLTENEVLDVMKREAKRRTEAVVLFKQGHRNEIVRKEEEEIAIIKQYLPAEMTKEAIGHIVDGLMKKGMRDFAPLIRDTMKEVKGQADGKTVTEVIKEKLESRLDA